MPKYYNPVNVIKTDDWLHELNIQKNKINIFNPLIVTSPGNRKRLHLETHFTNGLIFDDIQINPNIDDCAKIVTIIRAYKKTMFDGIIAIGGGSVMDLAKFALAYLCLDISNISTIINYKENYPKTIPSIFLPTTHGTGSEVTMWGTIWDIVGKKKYSISNIDLYPTKAILDGNLTVSLPLDISITSVMDALSHSFEAIWNKNANSISTKYAIEAIVLILNNVQKLKKNTTNMNVRNTLLYASSLAGLAFSNTKTAAAHSISYPLTLHFGIPHGIASSITLLPLLEINSHLIRETLDKICTNVSLTLDELRQVIINIPKDVIPYTLSEWGVTKNQLDQIVEGAFTTGRMDNNIVNLTAKNVKNILLEIY